MIMNNVSRPLHSEQESDHSDSSMHSEPVTPQTGPGTPYSDEEGSSSESQSDDESWGGGTKKSEDEDNSSDNESPRNRTLESPKGSDSDVGGRKSRKAAVDDLFGELSSDSDAEKPSTPAQPLDDATDGMEAEQPDKEQFVPEPCIIELEIPKVSTDLGSDIYFSTLPSSLFVQPKPFDSLYYEAEFEDELDEDGQAKLKLKVENTIRWRAKRDEQGNETRESNARIVKWSDGSMSLHLGNEVFDVCKVSPQGTHNHLFIRHGTFLQGLAVFKTKLTFKPHSTDNATHRKLSLADRHSKAQKIRMLPPGRDPDSQRDEMIKKEDERLRASLRRESQQRRMRMKQHHRRLSSSYLEPDRYDEEDDDGEQAISLAAIKSKYKGEGLRAERARIYSSDSDEGSDDDKAQRLMKAKTFDEEEEGKRKAGGDGGAATKRAKKSVISDEEEDEVDDE